MAEQAAWAAQVHSGHVEDPTIPADLSWGEAEQAMHAAVLAGGAAAREALGDDFDTPAALAALKQCAVSVDAYVQGASMPNSLAVLHARQRIQWLLHSLGLALPHHGAHLLGAQPSHAEGRSTDGGDSASFERVNATRVHLRELALGMLSEGGEGGGALAKAVLHACDTLRDHVLPGMHMGSAVSDDDAANAAARQAWQQLQQSQTAGSRTGKAVEAKKAKLTDWQQSHHWTDLSVHPEEVFRVDSQLYAQFEGLLPTHMADGTAISKNKLKKMRRAAERYAEKYNK